MGNLATTYQLIADILSFTSSDSELESKLSQPKIEWDNLVVEGSKHLVLPTIFCRLEQKGLVHFLPDDLRLYLGEISTINRNRNKRIINQVESISELFKAHKIDHVFLKGTALLGIGYYKDLAERMVGDIDILIPESQIQDAFTLLKNNGYSKTYGFAYTKKDFRHLDRLINEDELAAVELHRHVLNTNEIQFLNTEEILKSAHVINELSIPSKALLKAHLILAWQINDHGHFYQLPNFKVLYDIILLISHNGILTHSFNLKEFHSFFAIGKIYFKDFENINLNQGANRYMYWYRIFIKYPWLNKSIRVLKQYYLTISERLSLVLNNGNYRKHLIKKIFYSKK